MFEVAEPIVGGVQVIMLVFGLVQFFKELFNIEGKKVTVLSASMGILLFVAYRLIGVIPDPYQLIVEIVFQSLAFGLSASGYYKFVSERFPKSQS